MDKRMENLLIEFVSELADDFANTDIGRGYPKTMDSARKLLTYRRILAQEECLAYWQSCPKCGTVRKMHTCPYCGHA